MEIESCIYEWMEMASDFFDSMPFLLSLIHI